MSLVRDLCETGAMSDGL